MADFVLGIDAGGTKTRAAAFAIPDSPCNAPLPIAEAVSGCGNAALDPQASGESVFSAASQAIRKAQDAGFGKCRKILCGAAGVSSKVGSRTAADFLREKLLPLCGNTEVLSDAELSLIANFGGKGDGLLVISGTGSAVFLRNNGKVTRSGGWGHLLGDGGSGYHLSITALRLLVRQHDEGHADPALENAVFQFLGASDYPSLVSFVYGSPKSAVAALAPVIAALAEEGNASAASVIHTSAMELADDALRLLNREKPQPSSGSLPTALTGGCFEHLPLLRQCFLDAVTASTPVPLAILDHPADPAAAVLRDPEFQI